LAQVAPEECLYYTTWSAMAQPDPASDNHTEQLLAEPEIQQLIQEAEERLVEAFRRAALEEGEEELLVLSQTLPPLLKTVLTHAAAMYVSKVEMTPAGPLVDAGVVLHLGDEAMAARRHLERLEEQFLQLPIDDVSIDGLAFKQVRIAPGAPPITWGMRQNYLLIGAGEGAVQGMLQRLETPPPAWLTEVRERLPVARRSTLSYANLDAILDLTQILADDPKVSALIDALGMGNLKSLEATGGLDGNGFLTRTVIRMDGPPEGVLALLGDDALSEDDLKGIAADATFALSLRLDGAQLLDRVLDVATRVEPRAVRELQDGLDEIREELGLDIRSDILEALGDTWHVSTSPGSGGIVFGWTAEATVRDRDRLNATLNRMLGYAQASFSQGRRSPRIKQFQFAGETIYFLSVPDDDFLIAPAWCITDDRLMVGLFPQALKARLSHEEDSPCLAEIPEVAGLFRGDSRPVLVAYQDTRALFETFYPFLLMVARAAFSEFQEEGVDLDVSLLPSTGAVSKHLQPGVFTIGYLPEGIEFVARQTLPGSSVGTTAPISAALAIPAIQSARQAAQRTQSMNHLKQIGLAMHVYRESYGAFPPAYSIDENGTPLLSWRVHLLPFFDQDSLYREFHLDEPWDSEHNARLISRMPDLYQSPGITLGPGMTAYLGIRHEQSVLPPPSPEQAGESPPAGVTAEQIRDGMSRTLFVVEADSRNAVLWTRPQDYEPDAEDPLQGLREARQGGFLGVVCDGSVHFFPAELQEEAFRALITINGGEASDFPF
jgi:hypothetical protein